ncbi:hypothetical protein OAV13_00270 [bacterium]|nr:hypothetical protein [bacterium]
MHRVHVIGSSYTKWVYPTWADYIQKHYDVEFYNLAYSSQGNSIMKKQLYTVNKSDHVFIMFSGHHRSRITGVDEEFLSKYAIRNVVEPTKTHLLNLLKDPVTCWFRTSHPITAFVKSNFLDEYKPSKFQECYQMLEDIYDCQNYLQAKGIEHNFSMCQGFYSDHSEKRVYYTHKKIMDFSNYMQNPMYSKVFNSIDHDKFSPSIDKGLWEYSVDNKDLASVQSKIDLHPSSLCHFYFFKTFIKPILDQKVPNKDNIDHLYSQSKKFSKYYKKDVTVRKEYTEELKTKYFEIFEDQ